MYFLIVYSARREALCSVLLPSNPHLPSFLTICTFDRPEGVAYSSVWPTIYRVLTAHLHLRVVGTVLYLAPYRVQRLERDGAKLALPGRLAAPIRVGNRRPSRRPGACLREMGAGGLGQKVRGEQAKENKPATLFISLLGIFVGTTRPCDKISM